MTRTLLTWTAVLAAVAVYANPEHTFELPNGASMDCVWIEPGTFLMGTPESLPDALESSDDEYPQHQVTITRGFWLGKYELTQAQWQAVMGTTPWSGRANVQESADNPAVHISWNDVQALIHRLNEAEGDSLYRLPTEAEWEYACRAGTTTRWYFGQDAFCLFRHAWYEWNAGEKGPQPVGTKLPNPWGLHDMYGNVAEWVQDWMGGYSAEPQIDPKGPATGALRVWRGASWATVERFVYSAARLGNPPAWAADHLGVRLLRVAPQASTSVESTSWGAVKERSVP